MSTNKPFTCLIVDDERTARAKIQRYIGQDPRFEVINQASNGQQAIEFIETLHPDLVFLDVQMPGLSGFDVLRLLKNTSPAIVFTTAFEQYAISAFDVSALDYLLKPITATRFQQCLDKVTLQLEKEIKLKNHQLLDSVAPINQAIRLPVRKANSIIFLNLEDILFIRSEERLVRVYDKEGTPYWTNETLNQLEKRLNKSHFLRIHRNSLLNTNSKFELKKWDSGRLKIIFKQDLELVVSREYTAKVKETLV